MTNRADQDARETGTHLDGPTVNKFIRERLNDRESLDVVLGATRARVVCAWRTAGRTAQVDAVDRILTTIGSHLSELPAEAWDVDPPRAAAAKDGLRPEPPAPIITLHRAPACRCDRPMPDRDEDSGLRCLRCGRSLEAQVA